MAETEELNLYLLTQHELRGYDTYDSCVVVAASEDEAVTIRPAKFASVWPSPEHIKAQLIGIAANDCERGDVICASFNAG